MELQFVVIAFLLGARGSVDLSGSYKMKDSNQNDFQRSIEHTGR